MPDDSDLEFESADEGDEKMEKEHQKQPPKQNSWSWGAFEMISSASKSVAKVTKSLSSAIESNLNIPNPEEMAKIHQMEKQNEETKKNNEEPNQANNQSEGESVFKFDSLFSNVGLIVDTLEGIGKKTMTILQETDPNIKEKIRSINISSSKPNLSELLKEAKNSDTYAETEDVKSNKKTNLQSFEHLIEDFSGLVYFEALEMLSKQSKMKIELLMKPLSGKLLMDMEETLKEVTELCELPDSDAIDEKITTKTLYEHLTKATEDLAIQVNFKEIFSYSLELNKWLEEPNENDHESIYNKSIESLAKLCSLILNNYHKMAELMLSQNHRSTADEVDAVIQLTSIYFSLLNHVAAVFSEKIGKIESSGDTKKLSMELFIESANAISYVKKAFEVFIPILQIGAL